MGERGNEPAKLARSGHKIQLVFKLIYDYSNLSGPEKYPDPLLPPLRRVLISACDKPSFS
jgi:hypothetical protein